MARRSNIDGSLPQNVGIKKTNADFSSLTKTEQGLAQALVDTLFAKQDDLRETLYLKGVMRIDLILGRIESLLDKKLQDFTETQKENVKKVVLAYLKENPPTKETTTYNIEDIKEIIESVFTQNKDIILNSIKDFLEYQNANSENKQSDTKINNKKQSENIRTEKDNNEEESDDDEEKDESKDEDKKKSLPTLILMDDIFKASILDRIYEMEEIICEEIDSIDNRMAELIKNTRYTMINAQQKQSDKEMDMIAKMMEIIENLLHVIPIEDILRQSRDMVETIGAKIDLVCTILVQMAQRLIQAIQPVVSGFANQMIIAYYSSPLGIIVLLLSAVLFGIVYFFKDSKKFLELAINIGTIFVKVMIFIATSVVFVIGLLTKILNLLNKAIEMALSGLMWLVDIAWQYIIKPVILGILESINFVKDVILPPILNVYAWIIEKLIDAWYFIFPYVRDLVLFITDTLIGSVNNLLIPVLTPCLDMLTTFLNALTPILVTLTNVIFTLLYKLLLVIKSVVLMVAKFIAESFITSIELLSTIFDTFKKIGEYAVKIPEIIQNLPKFIWDKLMSIMPEFLQKAVALVCHALGVAWDAVKYICAGALNALKGLYRLFGGGPDIDELRERYNHLKWAWWTLRDARRYKYDQMRYSIINRQTVIEIEISLKNIASSLLDLYDTLFNILSTLPDFLKSLDSDDNKDCKVSDSRYDNYIKVLGQKLDVIQGIRENIDEDLEISLSENKNDVIHTDEKSISTENDISQIIGNNNSKNEANEDMWLDTPSSAYGELLNNIYWYCIEKFSLVFKYANNKTENKLVPTPVVVGNGETVSNIATVTI